MIRRRCSNGAYECAAVTAAQVAELVFNSNHGLNCETTPAVALVEG